VGGWILVLEQFLDWMEVREPLLDRFGETWLAVRMLVASWEVFLCPETARTSGFSCADRLVRARPVAPHLRSGYSITSSRNDYNLDNTIASTGYLLQPCP